MQQQKAATLATIFSEVLANLAFMFTDDEGVDSRPDDTWLETTIGYRGHSSGELTFRCTRRFTRLLAANLLGVDAEAESTDEADDAAKEFMNIVCGQLVTALHGSDDVFNLTIPQIRRLDEEPDLTLDDGVTASTLSVERCRIQLLYHPS